MSAKRILKKLAHSARVSLAILTAVPFSLGGTLANAAPPDQGHEKQHNQAQSPIQHVIVLIGENRTFDHVFATYIPRHGESVSNLLSKGIVNGDGTPGPVTTISASLYCGADMNTMAAATTGQAPINRNGDARIRDDSFAVPSTCLAPAILVNPNGIASLYIALDGFRM